MKSMLIVHPYDPSTIFLKPIWEFISNSHKEIAVLHIECDADQHIKAIEEISQPDHTNILFLGHGNSTALMGAKGEDYDHGDFIHKNDINLFQNKNVLSLSCRSSDFFRFENNFSYIGFDDIPSEITEVIGAREFESDRYKDVDEEVIESFKAILVNITCNSVNEWLLNNYPMKVVYHRIRIRTTQAIVQTSLAKSDLKFKRALISLLTDFKNNMSHYCCA